MRTGIAGICVGGVALCVALSGCGKKFNPTSGAPKPVKVINVGNKNIVRVKHPGWFPLVSTGSVDLPNKLNVTGSVFPDINREIPVISLASGRVVDIRATLDEHVHKGQLLLKVQSPDVTNAFDAYLKAKNNEQLADQSYVRAENLYAHGAISKEMLEQAVNAESDATDDLNAANQQLNTLGVNKNHPSDIVNVYAPISGVIVTQNVTDASAAGVAYSGSPDAFTIANLSRVWIICNVYANNLPQIRLGQVAKIHLLAYPNVVLTGRVDDIGPVLDPTLRTAKVRIVVPNPGMLRLGMFVTATLIGRQKIEHATVPADAVLHMHDEDWVFVPMGKNHFKRVEVQPGILLPGNQLEILSGITPGQKVVRSVLQLEATLEAQ